MATMSYANSLDPDQALQSIWSVLNRNIFLQSEVVLTSISNQQEKLPSMQREK